jgi:hypothetical protein
MRLLQKGFSMLETVYGEERQVNNTLQEILEAAPTFTSCRRHERMQELRW